MNFLKSRKKIIVIFIHAAIWMIYIALPLFGPASPDEPNFFSRRFLWSSLIFIAYFYLNYFLLIPFLFSKKKYLFFFFLTLILFSVIVYINTEIQKPPEFSGKRIERIPVKIPVFIFFKSAGTFLTFFFGSFAIKLSESWNKREKKLQISENERIKSELSYLKHQISPHFLFNSLNSVYSLAVKKSDKTPEVVLKLSNLMRYILDNRTTKQVSVRDEAEHIAKYIDLQKLRLFDIVSVDFEVDDKNLNKSIEPMLLIPFVENAFKYGVSYTKKCFIGFKLKVENDTLFFSSENRIFKGNESESNTGIGLKNVKRRLDILYPENYLLNIEETAETYFVNLTIKLENK